MKEDTNFLGEDFQNAIQIAVESESLDIEIEKLQKKQRLLREKAISKMKRLRQKKVKELLARKSKIEKEVNKVLNEREELVNEYCSEKGHKYVTIKTQTSGTLNYHSALHGQQHKIAVTYKCTVCGKIKHSNTVGRPTEYSQKYDCLIPEECLNYQYSKTGKTFKELTNELKDLLVTQSYIEKLLGEICEIFGHEVNDLNDPTVNLDEREKGIHTCKCCGCKIQKSDYEYHYKKAPYKGIVEYMGYTSNLSIIQARYTDISPITELPDIDIHSIEENIVLPGTRCEEEQKVLKRQKENTSSYFYLYEFDRR